MTMQKQVLVQEQARTATQKTQAQRQAQAQAQAQTRIAPQEAVEKVMEMAKPDFKARMAVKLAVAGAFHTDFMAPAVSKLEEVLKEVPPRFEPEARCRPCRD